MATLKLTRFQIHTMKKNPSILVFGPKRSGKSVLKNHLIYHINQHVKKFNAGFSMSGTREAKDSMKGKVPNSLNLDYTLDRFKKNWNTICDPVNEAEILDQDLSILVDMDDCTYDKQLLKCKEMRHMVMNGRHSNGTPIVCMQYCMDMPPEIRTNIDYVFVTKQTRRDVQEKMWKYFFGQFKKFEDFRKVLLTCTQNYEVLVLDCTVSDTSKIENCLFYFKADINIPNFKLFDERYWKMDEYLEKAKKEKRAQAETASNHGESDTPKSSSKLKLKHLSKISRTTPNLSVTKETAKQSTDPKDAAGHVKEISVNLQM